MLSFFTGNVIGQTIVGYMLMFIVPLLLPILFVKLVGFQGLKHLFSYEPNATIIHKLDPRFKIVYSVVIGILCIVLNWNYVFLLLLVTFIPWIFLKPSKARIQVTLTMALTPVIGMIWSQGLFYVPDGGSHLLIAFPWTIRWFGTAGLSLEGLYYGAQQAGRLLVPTSASLIILLSTTPSEIIWAFQKFRFPLVAGFTFTVALRFLPQMIERVTILQKAMQVRGYNLNAPRWWQLREWPDYIWRILNSIPTITVALLINSLRTTSVTAMVADARAFGSHNERATLNQHEMNNYDRIAWVALGFLFIFVIVLVSLNIGRRV